LTDAQAEDASRDAELKADKARITELKNASTVAVDIDEYDFQLFLIQTEIDEIKTRMDANQLLITEE
jgi:predicted  nucleic acid-binding Zn-ribbon protein